MSDTYINIPLEDIEVHAADNPQKKAEDSRYTLKSLISAGSAVLTGKVSE